MLPQLSLFQQCSIQSQDVMHTWLLGDAKMLNLFRNISWLSFTQSLMTVCILIWRVVLMCTYAVVTHPCDIPPLAQARPMMLCIYTSKLFITRVFNPVRPHTWLTALSALLNALILSKRGRGKLFLSEVQNLHTILL